MRLSLLKVTTFALLGLWNVLPRTEGLLSGLSRFGDTLDAPQGLLARGPAPPPKAPTPPKSEPPPPKSDPAPEGLGGAAGGSGAPGPKAPGGSGPAPAPAPKLGPFESNDYDYKPTKGYVDDDWGQTYTVKTKNFNKGDLDSLAINKDKHSIAVMEAWNGQESIPKTDPRKASLSDIEANLYVKEGGNLNDVSLIYHSAILKDEKDDARPGPDMHQVLLDVKKAMTGDPGHAGTVTLKRDSTGVEQDSFNKVMDTTIPPPKLMLNSGVFEV